MAKKDPEQDEQPADTNALLAQAITHLAANQLTPEMLRDIVAGTAKAAADAGSEGMRKVLHPQNAQHPGMSAFSYPEGDVARPKAALTRTVWFCGCREDPEQLTPEEIDLYNRFTGSRTARNGDWTADVRVNRGGKEDLIVYAPTKSIDDRMNLPSKSLMLRELLEGQAAVDPTALAQRVAELEARLAVQ